MTFISPWGTAPSGKNFGANIYIQDPVATGGQPAPMSGIDIYIASTLVGSPNLPTKPPSRGDVVLLKGVTWGPYAGLNQFVFGPTSTMTTLGQSALPPPLVMPSASLVSSSTSSNQYKGMRVVDKEAFSVVNNCPASMQYTPGG